jgi:hypothetical protein
MVPQRMTGLSLTPDRGGYTAHRETPTYFRSYKHNLKFLSCQKVGSFHHTKVLVVGWLVTIIKRNTELYI